MVLASSRRILFLLAKAEGLIESPDDEFPDLHGFGLSHDNHEWGHEQGLEGVIGQLIPFQEFHCQLAEGVHRKHGHLQVLVTSHLDEEVRQHSPDTVPHQPVTTSTRFPCFFLRDEINEL